MSETNHVETFPCPHCGAPIQYDGKGERTVPCPFCGQSVTVPENLLPRSVRPLFGAADVPGMSADKQAQMASLIASALRRGNKIEAIKVYRQYTGASLVAAKTAVEQIEASGPLAVGDTNDGDEVADASVARQPAASGSRVLLVPILVALLIVVGVAVLIFSVSGAFQPAPAEPTNDIAAQQRTLKATLLAQVATATPTPAPSPTPPYASLVLSFGKAGVGAGRFTNAARIGVDGKGSVYVGEYDGGRVQVFDASGKFISQFSPADPHTKLEGFAVSRDGDVYTSDDATVTVYNGQTGQPLRSLSYTGGPGFGELALAPDGGLAAMWYPHRNGAREGPENLVLFDPQGRVTTVISAPISSQTGEYEYENVPVFDGRGTLYVVSHVSSAVFVFSPQGKFINRFGSAGKAKDQIDLPHAAAIDSQGQLYVADGGGVAEYTPEGRFVRRFEVQNGVRAMVFNDTDELWVLQTTVVTRFALGQ